MAFQQPTAQRPNQNPTTTQPISIPAAVPTYTPQVSDSQEWILFAPSARAESSTNRTVTTETAGLSRVSDFGSLQTADKSGQVNSSVLDEEAEDDAELDDLDEGLNAFSQPGLYTTVSNNNVNGPILPTHDGLGSFQASSSRVLEQLWQHEQYNVKRKHDGHHHRTASSIYRHLDTIEELEAQANEEKRLRIEMWRIEQSQALLQEVEKETRRKHKRGTGLSMSTGKIDDVLATTPKQDDFLRDSNTVQQTDNEPFWRRITRRFIHDIIGIDDPLLSVILGESLPGEDTPRLSSPVLQPVDKATESDPTNSSWRDRLLQRIAKELGVFVHQLTPHPGAFSTYTAQDADYTTQDADYAGMSVCSTSQPTNSRLRTRHDQSLESSSGVKFTPTIKRDLHADETWGIDEEDDTTEANLNLRKEREYWERELDVKMVFKYLKDRFNPALTMTPDPANTAIQQPAPSKSTIVFQKDSSARRAAIIREHHPLVVARTQARARTHRSPAQIRRDSRLTARRGSSSCASESLKGSRKGAAGFRSGSSRNYWDLGGSGNGGGSGSLVASGGMMGAW